MSTCALQKHCLPPTMHIFKSGAVPGPSLPDHRGAPRTMSQSAVPVPQPIWAMYQQGRRRYKKYVWGLNPHSPVTNPAAARAPDRSMGTVPASSSRAKVPSSWWVKQHRHVTSQQYCMIAGYSLHVRNPCVVLKQAVCVVLKPTEPPPHKP